MKNLKSIRDISFIVAIYMYFCGWVYIYYYLHFFGISIASSGIDFYSFITYFYSVAGFYLASFWNASLFFGALIIIVLLMRWLSVKGKEMLLTILTASVLIILVPISFFFSQKAGIGDARTQTDSNTSDLKYIKFSFSDSIPGANIPYTSIESLKFSHESLDSLNNATALRLILLGTDEYFVLYSDYQDPASSPVIYHIPKDKIKFAKIITFN